MYVARYGADSGVFRVNQSGDASLGPRNRCDRLPEFAGLRQDGNLYISESFSSDAPLTEYRGCDIGFGPFFGPGGIWRVAPGRQRRAVAVS